MLHGALLDAEILADVYLLMSGGQEALNLSNGDGTENSTGRRLHRTHKPLKIIRATDAEIEAHQERLDLVEKSGSCLWRQ